jgi:AraC-like DNA-binding protein
LGQKSIHIVENSSLLTKELIYHLSGDFKLTDTDCTLKSLDMLYLDSPDLILLGLGFQFPLDTISYIKLVSKLSKFSSTPLVLIGESDKYSEIESGLKHGAIDFITVPFIDNNLIHRLKTNISFNEQNRNKVFKAPIKTFISFEETFKKQFTSLVNSILYEKPPTMVVLANIMAMSVSSLERYCKLYFGNTPIKYIINLKLEMSLVLLKTNNGNVKYVSNYLCFSSVPYFCLCFKNKYKESPKKYINKMVNTLEYNRMK